MIALIKKTILILIIVIISLLLLSTIAIGKKPKKTKELKENNFNNQEKEKLSKYYGKKFRNVVDYNSYKNDSVMALINVTLENNEYARIITPTSRMEEVLQNG